MEAAAIARARAAALAAAKGLSGTGNVADAFLGTTNAEFLRRRAQFEDVSSVDFEETADGQWIKRVDINDNRNRYLLSKTETMQRISEQTGAHVMAKGKYYPDRLLANDAMPPLHLIVTSSDRDAIDRAVEEIQRLLDQQISVGTGANEVRPLSSFWEEKLFPGMENSSAFPLRSKIIGPQGSYIRHIHQQSGARVQLKGQGSGFRELATGLESDEPLHIHISYVPFVTNNALLTVHM